MSVDPGSLAFVALELQRRTDRATGVESFRAYLDRITPWYEWDAPHLVYLQARLEALAAREIRRLIVSCPPRHGKSELASIRFPVWCITRGLAKRVCVGTYNQEFANRFGRRSRRLAEQDIQVSQERSAAREWEHGEDGVYRSCGRGSPPTGLGLDALLIDDPIKSREEADSPIVREECWDWYREDLVTRLEPDAIQLVITTRWHEDDLVGRILGSEMGAEWEVVNLPAVAEDGDPLGRDPGAALWPERYGAEALAEIRRTVGDAAWTALYQGRPSPREGQTFRVAMLEAEPVAPAGLRRVRAWDLAYSAGHGDWTVGVLMGGPDADGRYHVLDVVRGQWDAGERNRIVRQTAEADGTETAIRVPQDPGAGKDVGAALVRLLAGYSVSATIARGSKQLRADPLAAQVGAGNVRLLAGEWNAAFREELRAFPSGAHDDQVDAAADAFSFLARTERRLPGDFGISFGSGGGLLGAPGGAPSPRRATLSP